MSTARRKRRAGRGGCPPGTMDDSVMLSIDERASRLARSMRTGNPDKDLASVLTLRRAAAALDRHLPDGAFRDRPCVNVDEAVESASFEDLCRERKPRHRDHSGLKIGDHGGDLP